MKPKTCQINSIPETYIAGRNHLNWLCCVVIKINGSSLSHESSCPPNTLMFAARGIIMMVTEVRNVELRLQIRVRKEPDREIAKIKLQPMTRNLVLATSTSNKFYNL